MTNQRISAIVVATLAACGILVWALAQAQSRHTQLVNTVAAASQPAATTSAATNQSAASATVVAAADPAPQHCDCNCTPPVRPKHHAKLKKKVYRPYQSPEPFVPPVAVALPPPPVYSPPVAVAPPVPAPVVVGNVVPYYYGYGGYPVASLSYYNGYRSRYWGNSGPHFIRGGPVGRATPRGGYGYRR